MLLSELVEDVSRVKTGIVAELAGDDFKGLGVGSDDELLLARDGLGVLAEDPSMHFFFQCYSKNHVCLVTWKRPSL